MAVERPTAAALSYSPITILKLRIRLRRLRNYCKVEAGRRRERERWGEGRGDKTWPTFGIQTDMRSGRREGRREGAKDQVGHSQLGVHPTVRPSVRSFVALLEFVLRGSPFFPRVHHGLPNLGARGRRAGGAAGVGAGQNAKHQPVMIHPSISPARPSRLSSLAGDGQHAADRPAERQGEEEEEGLLPSSLFALPPSPSLPLTHSLSPSFAGSLSLVVTLWRPCSPVRPLARCLCISSF